MSLRSLVLVLAAAAALLPTPAPAATQDRLRVEVLVDGRVVREHHDRGTTYVEALRNREYSLRVTNLDSARVAVALAVDGRNTIDGRRTSAADARKWVLEPWQSVTVTGWQVGADRARKFFFTTEDASYADWLGDTRHVGVIEAVAFRERPRDLAWHEPWPRAEESRSSSDRDARRDRPQAAPSASDSSSPAKAQAGSAAGAGAGAPSQRAMGEQGSSRDGSSAAKRESVLADSAANAEREAATGIGRDVRNDVVRVEFEPESSPSSSVRVRYEYREALIALGVLPRPEPENRWSRRERATGFDDSYCPEPRR